MENVFEQGPDDIRLAALMAEVGAEGPGGFDEAADLYGRLAMRARPALIGIVTRYKAENPASIVDEVVKKGIEMMVAVFNRESPTFVYRGDRSLASFLGLMIGDPKNPKLGGVIHRHLRAERERRKREVEFDETYTVDVSEEAESRDERIDELGEHLGCLCPRQRLIIDVYYGLQGRGFGIDDIRARCEDAGFSSTEVKAIVARARRLRIDPSSKALKQDMIASLLDIGVATVCRDLKEARQKLFEAFKRSRSLG